MTTVSVSAKPQAVEKKKTIVLVEDDSTNALMLDLVLQGEHLYQTMHFLSGEQTLEHLESLRKHRPALFLLDYCLPRMTGLELYEYLHATQDFEKVPAILLTGKSISKTEQEHIAQQHLSILTKPFSLDDLLSSIQQALL